MHMRRPHVLPARSLLRLPTATILAILLLPLIFGSISGSSQTGTVEPLFTLIASPGRAGTSLLMAIFTHLGMPTGFPPDGHFMQNFIDRGLSGFEGPLQDALEHTKNRSKDPATRIYKNPRFCLFEGERQQFIEACRGPGCEVIVPLRKTMDAAMSRLRNSKNNQPLGALNVDNFFAEVALQYSSLADLLVELTSAKIPTTFLMFQEFRCNSTYLFDRLQPLFVRYGITEQQLHEAHMVVAHRQCSRDGGVTT